MDTREQIASRQAEAAHSPFEETPAHRTYYFEMQLVEVVRQGSVPGLTRFLAKNAGQPLGEGKLAEDPLRQAKDIFIGLVVSVAKHGAIPGGLKVEEAYQLIDLYIQAAERADTVTDVNALRYDMLVDFTDRVGRAKLPEGISSDIFAALQLIHGRFAEGVSVEEIARAIHRSRAYLQKKFKAELGQSVGAYVIACRMREAQTLLKFTDQSLADISIALGFSSQAYFQSAFKKAFGVTPAAYRRMQGMGR